MSLQEIWEILRSFWVVWLVILFVGIVVWTFLPRNKKRWDEASKIVMRDDDETEDK